MATPEGTAKRINGILRYLVKSGLARAQKPAVCCSYGRFKTVSFPGAEHVSVALKNRDYRETYLDFLRRRAYTVLMLDNAVIQIMYRFRGSKLVGHRLAFFAAPELMEFQNAPDWYLHDDPFVDIQERTTAPTLIRFDYNADEERHQSVVHPKSHLTLGRYEECRIPVSAPLTPYCFVDFVLRNFYDTRRKLYSSRLPRSRNRFAESINADEQRLMHMVVPG